MKTSMKLNLLLTLAVSFAFQTFLFAGAGARYSADELERMGERVARELVAEDNLKPADDRLMFDRFIDGFGSAYGLDRELAEILGMVAWQKRGVRRVITNGWKDSFTAQDIEQALAHPEFRHFERELLAASPGIGREVVERTWKNIFLGLEVSGKRWAACKEYIKREEGLAPFGAGAAPGAGDDVFFGTGGMNAARAQKCKAADEGRPTADKQYDFEDIEEFQYIGEQFRALLAVPAGRNPALWSGGIALSEYARQKQFLPLETTALGNIMNKLYLRTEWTGLGVLWNVLSETYTENAARDLAGAGKRAQLHVFTRTLDPNSVLIRQELPQLTAGAAATERIKYRLVYGEDDDLKEIGKDGELMKVSSSRDAPVYDTQEEARVALTGFMRKVVKDPGLRSSAYGFTLVPILRDAKQTCDKKCAEPCPFPACACPHYCAKCLALTGDDLNPGFINRNLPPPGVGLVEAADVRERVERCLDAYAN